MYEAWLSRGQWWWHKGSSFPAWLSALSPPLARRRLEEGNCTLPQLLPARWGRNRLGVSLRLPCACINWELWGAAVQKAQLNWGQQQCWTDPSFPAQLPASKSWRMVCREESLMGTTCWKKELACPVAIPNQAGLPVQLLCIAPSWCRHVGSTKRLLTCSCSALHCKEQLWQHTYSSSQLPASQAGSKKVKEETLYPRSLANQAPYTAIPCSTGQEQLRSSSGSPPVPGSVRDISRVKWWGGRHVDVSGGGTGTGGGKSRG